MQDQDQMTMERLNRIFEELGVKPEQVAELSEPNAYRITVVGDHIVGLLRTLGFKCELLSPMPAYDKFRQTTLEWLAVYIPARLRTSTERVNFNIMHPSKGITK